MAARVGEDAPKVPGLSARANAGIAVTCFDVVCAREQLRVSPCELFVASSDLVSRQFSSPKTRRLQKFPPHNVFPRIGRDGAGETNASLLMWSHETGESPILRDG